MMQILRKYGRNRSQCALCVWSCVGFLQTIVPPTWSTSTMLKQTAVVAELDDTFIPLASSTIQGKYDFSTWFYANSTDEAFPLFAKSSAIGAIGHLSAMSIRFQQHQSAFKLRFNAAMSTPDYHVYLLNGINAVLSPSSIFGCELFADVVNWSYR
jgi:hypothetical protein